MALSNEDAETIAEIVKRTIGQEQAEMVEQINELVAGLTKQVDEYMAGIQQFVVERTTGIDNDKMAEIMVARFDDFWTRAIVANYVANKKKGVVDE